MLITLKQLLDDALEYNYGVPAFNVNNMEQGKAIMAAAHETSSPVILQVSQGAIKYAGLNILVDIIKSLVKEYPYIPVCLHLDHGSSIEECAQAIHAGFTSVMIDGSLKEDKKTPNSLLENINISKKATEYAHRLGVSVEAEIGCLGSLETGEAAEEDGHGAEGTLTREQMLTDINHIRYFESHLGCNMVDALAVAMGTSHGLYKFTREPDEAVLSMSTLKEVAEKFPKLPLVMHGSSSVLQHHQDDFRDTDGEMEQTWGVPLHEIGEAIRVHHVCKINIDTDCRLVMAAAIRKVVMEDPKCYDPRSFLKPATHALKELCINRMQFFECEGRANFIKPKSLNEMKSYYPDGI